jgi:hypothetical protein
MPKSKESKALVGGVFVIQTPDSDQMIPFTIMCEATQPNTVPSPPFLDGELVFCSEGKDLPSSTLPQCCGPP